MNKSDTAIAVIVLATLAFISSMGCAPQSPEVMPRKSHEPTLHEDTGRFRLESHGYFFDGKFYSPHRIYVIDDTVTGKSYVVVTDAGICETPRK